MADHPSLPRWNDVLASKGRMFKWLHNPSLTHVGSIVLLRHDQTTLPTIIMRYPDRVFRKPIDALTFTSVQFDVVTVFPYQTPLAYILLVIFDDYNEPFSTVTCLKMFPFSGLPKPDQLTAAPTYLVAREIISRLCQSPSQCGIILFNEEFKVRKASIIKITRPNEVRRREIAEVIEFLSKFTIERHNDDFFTPKQLLDELFCASVPLPNSENLEIIVRPNGSLPANAGSLIATADHVLSIQVADNRLIDRRAVIESAEQSKAKYDVFISHAHADSSSAQQIARWLKHVFPRIRIAFTKPRRDDLFKRKPTYFIDDSLRAKCLLYLFTPHSKERPMIDTEIGINADKPIITLLLGTKPQDLNEKLHNNLFLSLDLSKAISLEEEDAWRKLAASLAVLLGQRAPQELPAKPVVQFVSTSVGAEFDLIQSYIIGYQYMRADVHRRHGLGGLAKRLLSRLRSQHRE